MRLHGRTALVTGAARGSGFSIARAFAREGANVVVADIDGESAGRSAEDLAAPKDGGSAVGLAMDVADPDSVAAGLKGALDAFGRVDILVNNAGIGTAHPATRETPEQFREVIDINLNGCYWMAQAAGKVMESGSSIVNVSSVLALTTAGLPQAAYSASKAGLIGLTRDLAQQWTGRKGIRVNSIAPGFFASEMTEQYPPGYLESQQGRIPAGRKGDPRELAAAVVFLASPAGGYVTGQTLAVDGGMTIT